MKCKNCLWYIKDKNECELRQRLSDNCEMYIPIYNHWQEDTDHDQD